MSNTDFSSIVSDYLSDLDRRAYNSMRLLKDNVYAIPNCLEAAEDVVEFIVKLREEYVELTLLLEKERSKNADSIITL